MNIRKTIRDYFNEIEDVTFKLMLFDNVRPWMLDTKVSSFSDALSWGFWWLKSNEGYLYWESIWDCVVLLEHEGNYTEIKLLTHSKFKKQNENSLRTL